jgi:hypothetical protein
MIVFRPPFQNDASSWLCIYEDDVSYGAMSAYMADGKIVVHDTEDGSPLDPRRFSADIDPEFFRMYLWCIATGMPGMPR